MRMARVLVTGAAGFIGSHLVRRLLAEGWEVVGLDRRPPPAAGLHWLQGDLLELDLAPHLAGVDYVIHLAGRPGVRESWSDFAEYARGNIEATQRLLEALRGQKVRKLVVASTSSVYGEAPMPAREEGPLLPVSPYGVTKWAAEQLCHLYGRTAHIPWVALRYFTVYGPGQRPDMAFARWTAAALAGRPIEVYGDGEQRRDFTYVDDAVEATIRAALAPVSGVAVNVGGGRPVSIREAIAELERVAGRSIAVEHRPPARGDMRATLADTERLERELGYLPSTPLAEGLRRQWTASGGGGGP
jgi:UDP-glucuronate 4-epimerase